MRWTVRRGHKWMAVIASLMLVMWCVSAISMVLPHWGLSPRTPAAPDWREAQVAPDVAIRAAATLIDDRSLAAESVQLRPLLGAPVYSISFDGGSTVFVDARTGKAFGMDADLARRVAEAARGVDARTAQRIDHYGRTYLNGDLPAYRVDFTDGGPGAVVSARSGTVVLTTSWSLLRQGLAAAHDGRVVELLLGRTASRLISLAFAALTVAATVTGLWLVLPVWRRAVRVTPMSDSR